MFLCSYLFKPLFSLFQYASSCTNLLLHLTQLVLQIKSVLRHVHIILHIDLWLRLQLSFLLFKWPHLYVPDHLLRLCTSSVLLQLMLSVRPLLDELTDHRFYILFKLKLYLVVAICYVEIRLIRQHNIHSFRVFVRYWFPYAWWRSRNLKLQFYQLFIYISLGLTKMHVSLGLVSLS